MRYEIVLLIDAETDDKARAAADAAWYAADESPGSHVVEGVAHMRTARGVRPVKWDEWDDESTITVRIGYSDEE